MIYIMRASTVNLNSLPPPRVFETEDDKVLAKMFPAPEPLAQERTHTFAPAIFILVKS